MKEKWKPVKGFKGLYEVSNLGNVKSLTREVYCPATKNHKAFTYIKKGRILKPDKLKDGYCQVYLFKNGKGVFRKVHRLVAEAFIPNPKKKPQVNHINGIKHDNRAENLEWVTVSENTFHAYRVLKIPPSKGSLGKPSKYRKLTDEQVEAIRNDPRSQAAIAKDYGVVHQTISNIKLGISYKTKSE